MSASSSNISFWLRIRSKAFSNLSNLSNAPGIGVCEGSRAQGKTLGETADEGYDIFEGLDN